MSIKITIPNSSSDVLTFGSGNTPTAAQIAGIDSGSSNGQLALYTTASGTSTERVRVDSSGNVGIGTASPSSFTAENESKLTVGTGSGNGGITVYTGSTSQGGIFFADGTSGAATYSGILRYNHSDNAMLFYTNGLNERARIDSSGVVKINRTTNSSQASNAILQVLMSNSNNVAAFENSNATPFGIDMYYSGAAPNNTSSVFYNASDTGGIRFSVRSNGGIANYSANNVNLSDRREKTNFAPAGDYLAKICAIPVQTFNYIDQNMDEDDGLTLGVVAQDVQTVAPEMVMESNWGTEDEPKMRLSIYQTDLQYALMKCIQEQQAIITSLTDRITALENK